MRDYILADKKIRGVKDDDVVYSDDLNQNLWVNFRGHYLVNK